MSKKQSIGVAILVAALGGCEHGVHQPPVVHVVHRPAVAELPVDGVSVGDRYVSKREVWAGSEVAPRAYLRAGGKKEQLIELRDEGLIEIFPSLTDVEVVGFDRIDCDGELVQCVVVEAVPNVRGFRALGLVSMKMFKRDFEAAQPTKEPGDESR
jgi:hypothetical protein